MEFIRASSCWEGLLFIASLYLLPAGRDDGEGLLLRLLCSLNNDVGAALMGL
jgi:hypothetical protein